MCDTAYVLMLQSFERHFLTERQIAAVLIAAGSADLKAPDYAAARAEFDAGLEANPLETEGMKLLRELGVD